MTKPYMLVRDLFDPLRYGLHDSATGQRVATIHQFEQNRWMVGSVQGLPNIKSEQDETLEAFADRLYLYAQQIAPSSEPPPNQESLFG
jgi:hypothetical protein